MLSEVAFSSCGSFALLCGDIGNISPVSWVFHVGCSLQDGSYLLSHAAEDSSLLIYKTSDGKVTRTAYNLHKAHCDLPGVPSSLSVPWVPLDPSYLLPYHIHHGRIPCTFPPKSLRPVAQPKVRSSLWLYPIWLLITNLFLWLPSMNVCICPGSHAASETYVCTVSRTSFLISFINQLRNLS